MSAVTDRRILGTWSLPVLAAVIAGAGVLLLIAVDISVAAPATTSEVAAALAPISVACALFGLMATARIVGVPGHYILLIGFLTYRRVPISLIRDVRADDGLTLVLASGSEVRSVPFGRSLLGQLVGYPRSVRAAERIRAFISVSSGRALSSEVDATVTPQVRTAALAGAVAGAALVTALGVLVNLGEFPR